MNAKIVLGWESSLLKNQAYVNGDPKLGHTKQCEKAMWDIKMLLTSVGYSFDSEGERIKVIIIAYRPRENIDAQNLIDACSDAIELGIHVDDKNFDIGAFGKIDKIRPRIEIIITQKEIE